MLPALPRKSTVTFAWFIRHQFMYFSLKFATSHACARLAECCCVCGSERHVYSHPAPTMPYSQIEGGLWTPCRLDWNKLYKSLQNHFVGGLPDRQHPQTTTMYRVVIKAWSNGLLWLLWRSLHAVVCIISLFCIMFLCSFGWCSRQLVHFWLTLPEMGRSTRCCVPSWDNYIIILFHVFSVI